VKPTSHLVLGILLLLGASFWALVMLAVLTVPPVDDSSSVSSSAPLFAVCTAAFAVPAIISLYTYSTALRRLRDLEIVAVLLRSGPEIRLKDVAAHIGKSVEETDLLVSRAVSEGLARGFVDHDEKKFVAAAIGPIGPPRGPTTPIPATPGPPASTEMRFCRICGGRVEPVPGQAAYRCTRCGNLQAPEG